MKSLDKWYNDFLERDGPDEYGTYANENLTYHVDALIKRFGANATLALVQNSLKDLVFAKGEERDRQNALYEKQDKDEVKAKAREQRRRIGDGHAWDNMYYRGLTVLPAFMTGDAPAPPDKCSICGLTWDEHKKAGPPHPAVKSITDKMLEFGGQRIP